MSHLVQYCTVVPVYDRCISLADTITLSLQYGTPICSIVHVQYVIYLSYAKYQYCVCSVMHVICIAEWHLACSSLCCVLSICLSIDRWVEHNVDWSGRGVVFSVCVACVAEVGTVLVLTLYFITAAFLSNKLNI